jgi:acetyl-CoA acetyltransferase
MINKVYVVEALRTPFTRAGTGGFKHTQLEGMLAPLLSALMERTGLRPDIIEEVIMGNVLDIGAG